MPNSQRPRRMKVRTLFLSDVHLGFKRARTRELNEFLHGVEAESIVLVGDIVDALSMARRFFWSPEHTQVVRTLLARQRAGARLVYIPGNHDASLGVMAGMLQGQLEVHREWVHRTARGERLLVMHGDQFDGIVSCAPWLTKLGDAMYELTVMLSHGVNNLRRAMKRPYWPVAERIKLSIPVSVRYIAQFENVAASHAREQGYDGVVCGHIHRANLRHIDGTLYCNTGDWVESCSALVEKQNGELELLRWPHASGATRRTTAELLPDVGACRTQDRLLRPPHIGCFPRSFRLHKSPLCARNDRKNQLDVGRPRDGDPESDRLLA